MPRLVLLLKCMLACNNFKTPSLPKKVNWLFDILDIVVIAFVTDSCYQWLTYGTQLTYRTVPIGGDGAAKNLESSTKTYRQ